MVTTLIVPMSIVICNKPTLGKKANVHQVTTMLAGTQVVI